MLKQVIVIVALSILIILTMPYVQHGLQFLLTTHNRISDLLTQVFSGGEAGNVARKLIALLAVPMLVSFVIALIYWFIKRSWFPYFMEITWVLWLVQTAALAIQYSIT